MVQREQGGPQPPTPPPPPGEGEESGGAPPPPDPTVAALELQGLSLGDERPLEDEAGEQQQGEGGSHGAGPHRFGEPGGPAPQVPGRLEDLEIQGTAVTSSAAAVTSSAAAVTSAGAGASVAAETMTSEAAVTSVGQLMFSHRTDRRLILLGPHQRDPPCVLALRSSVQGAIGLQRAGSLPRRRGERGVPSPAPRPRSHHGQGILALQLDPESYSTCLQLAELERRVREALAERERLLRAREARRAAEAPPPPAPAPPPPPPEQDLALWLRGRGHRPDGCRWLRLSGGSCRGPLTKRGGRIRTWRRRWFHLDPGRRVLAYYGDKEETKLKGVIYFQAIEEVYHDQGRVACKSPNPRLTFCVKTYDRLFCLVAPSAEALRIWMDAVLALARGDAAP